MEFSGWRVQKSGLCIVFPQECFSMQGIMLLSSNGYRMGVPLEYITRDDWYVFSLSYSLPLTCRHLATGWTRTVSWAVGSHILNWTNMVAQLSLILWNLFTELNENMKGIFLKRYGSSKSLFTLNWKVLGFLHRMVNHDVTPDKVALMYSCSCLEHTKSHKVPKPQTEYEGVQ